MKIQNKKSHKKVVLTIVILLIVALGVGGYFFAKSQNFFAKKSTTSSSSSSTENTPSSATNNTSTSSNSSNSSANNSTPTPVPTEPKPKPQTDDPNTTNGSLTVSAVAFRSGASLSVQNIVIYSRDNSGNYHFLSGGTCTLTAGSFSTSQAINPAHTGSNYTICDNFSAPLSQISGSSFTINVKSDQGQTATYTGNIQ